MAAPPPPEETTVCILGSGFSGLAMGARLRQEGVQDFVILERARSVGGTWRDNTYPGAACDIPSHLYSLSFQPEPGWSHRYARQPEIRAYLESVADRQGLRPHLRFGADATRAAFDEATGRWRVETRDGRVFRARFLVAGLGPLRDPRYPDLPGRETFAGPSLHSARWDPGVDLAGKRVGVVGTGASAIQVVPELAGVAAHLTVFQRTPPWVVPRHDRPYTAAEQAAFRHVPGLLRLVRWSLYLEHESRYPVVFGHHGWVAGRVEALVRRHIRRQVGDPALAARLTPPYAMGCKRVLISNDWYPTLARPDVRLEDTAITAVEPAGLRLADGRGVDLDALVWCTGFQADDPLGTLTVQGRDGVDLRTAWAGRPKAWLGLSVPGFPNAFLLLGPNTGLGHNSVVLMIEAQVRYVLQAIAHTRALGERAWLDVDQAHLDAFLAEVDTHHAGQVWATGCRSWYLSERGENFTIWPGSVTSYLRRTRRFDPGRATAGGL